MFSNTYNELKPAFTSIRDVVLSHGGDVNIINYLFDNACVEYHIPLKDNNIVFTLTGMPWTHIEELKEKLNGRQPRKINVQLKLYTSVIPDLLPMTLRKQYTDGYHVQIVGNLMEVKSRCINMAGGNYYHEKDTLKPKALSSAFNDITNVMMESGQSIQAQTFRRFFTKGVIKVDFYGNKCDTIKYDVSALSIEINSDTTIIEAMRELRYMLVNELVNPMTVRIRSLKLVDISLQVDDYTVANLHVARNKDEYWEAVIHKLPHTFSIIPLLDNSNEGYHYPRRDVSERVKHAPLLNPLMGVLLNYTVQKNGTHYCLSTELIDEIHQTLEKYVSDRGIYLKLMDKVENTETSKEKRYESEIINVTIPGLDISGDVQYSLPDARYIVDKNMPFVFTHISQFRFDDGTVTGVATYGMHRIEITVKIDWKNTDFDTLTSAFTTLATEAMVKWQQQRSH